MSRREVQAFVRDRLGMGKATAAAFLTGRLKAAVGVQAPRIKRGGRWQATTRASAGAPPRRVSGAGQRSIAWKWTPARNMTFFARMWYMMWLEQNGHPWLRPTINKYLKDVGRIVGAEMKVIGKRALKRA